jgi:hypothetical protein
MNRKEAEMNVLWEGKPTQFKNINDPVVLPRLNATLDAHKLLWSIRLLVRRSLTPEQQQLAMDLCEIELLCHHKERAEKKKGIYTQVVERALAAENRSIPPSAKVFQERVGKIVRDLTVASHNGENFSKRLREAINLNFPASSQAPGPLPSIPASLVSPPEEMGSPPAASRKRPKKRIKHNRILSPASPMAQQFRPGTGHSPG